MEQFNIEVCTTAAESSWGNVVCESNQAVVDLMNKKMGIEDKSLIVEEALAHVVSAKNCLQNYNDFAPIQLVTWVVPILPTAMVNGLPALEEAERDCTKNYLEKMYSTRCAFIKSIFRKDQMSVETPHTSL